VNVVFGNKSYRLISPGFPPMSTSHNYNLGQNKKEQLTPSPPKQMMKARRGKNRAILASYKWGGGSRCSIYFVQACSRLGDDFHVSNILRCIFIRRCLFGKMLLKVNVVLSLVSSKILRWQSCGPWLSEENTKTVLPVCCINSLYQSL